jgi:hypothetical protein
VIGNFSSGAGKCLSTGGCQLGFFVEACQILSDNLGLKQSSVVVSVLAQKMLLAIRICRADRA